MVRSVCEDASARGCSREGCVHCHCAEHAVCVSSFHEGRAAKAGKGRGSILDATAWSIYRSAPWGACSTHGEGRSQSRRRVCLHVHRREGHRQDTKNTHLSPYGSRTSAAYQAWLAQVR